MCGVCSVITVNIWGCLPCNIHISRTRITDRTSVSPCNHQSSWGICPNIKQPGFLQWKIKLELSVWTTAFTLLSCYEFFYTVAQWSRKCRMPHIQEQVPCKVRGLSVPAAAEPIPCALCSQFWHNDVRKAKMCLWVHTLNPYFIIGQLCEEILCVNHRGFGCASQNKYWTTYVTIS